MEERVAISCLNFTILVNFCLIGFDVYVQLSYYYYYIYMHSKIEASYTLCLLVVTFVIYMGEP